MRSVRVGVGACVAFALCVASCDDSVTPRRRAPALALDVAAVRRLASESEDGTVTRAISSAIVRAGPDAVPVLVEALRSPDEPTWDGAVDGLLIVPRLAVPTVLALTTDAQADVRTHALVALARLEDWWAARDEGADIVRAVAAGLSRGDDEESGARLRIVTTAGRHASVATAEIAELARTAQGELGDRARGWMKAQRYAATPEPDDEASRRRERARLTGNSLQAIGERAKATHDPAEIARVAAFLSSPNPKRRLEAGNLLLEIGTAPPDCIGAVRENLRSPDRLVRLGAVRTAVVLGPAAAPAIPELLPMIHVHDLGDIAFEALAGTNVLDDEVRASLAALVEERSEYVCGLPRMFGRRASFLEPALRELALEDPKQLAVVAGTTADSAAFAAWVTEHRERFDSNQRIYAFAALEAPGVPALINEVAARKHCWFVAKAREHVHELGASAVGPLEEVVDSGEPAAAAMGLDFLADVAAREKASVFAENLSARDPAVRAAAARGVGAALRSGADARAVVPLLVSRLDDEPAVRAASLHALALTDTPPGDTVERARAALDDDDARVQVAAADAVFAWTGDADAVLPVLRATLNVPAPFWGGWGHQLARPEDEYSETERLWVAAARVLARIGPAAAPAAEDLAWAALRHGEPRMQGLLVDAIAPMGRDAAAAGPLLLRLAETSQPMYRLQIPSEELDAALDRALDALGLEAVRRDPWGRPR